jgi:hypothetical protein
MIKINLVTKIDLISKIKKIPIESFNSLIYYNI